jgi:hypothetical protein
MTVELAGCERKGGDFDDKDKDYEVTNHLDRRMTRLPMRMLNRDVAAYLRPSNLLTKVLTDCLNHLYLHLRTAPASPLIIPCSPPDEPSLLLYPL